MASTLVSWYMGWGTWLCRMPSKFFPNKALLTLFLLNQNFSKINTFRHDRKENGHEILSFNSRRLIYHSK